MIHYIETLLNTKTRHRHYNDTISRPERGNIYFRINDSLQVLLGKASAVTFYEDMTPNMYCEECKKIVTTNIYNQDVIPMILTCEECGEFLQQ